MGDIKLDKLYKYLRSQFSNLEEAISWYNEWVRNGQNIDGYPEWSCDSPDPNGGFSMRTMAGHISDVLTGDNDFQEHYCYMDTKYGSRIYLNRLER